MEEMQCFYAKDRRIPFDIQAIGKSVCEMQYFSRRECSEVTSMEFVTEGTGTVIYNGTEYHPSAGDTFIVQTGANHVHTADRRHPWRKLWITVYGYYVNSLMTLYGIDHKFCFHVDTRDLFERLRELSVSNLPYEQLCAEVATVLQRIIHRLALSVKEKQTTDKQAIAIKDFMDTKVEERINLDVVADRFYLSKSQIIRIFRKNFEQTPYEYILEKKIEAAKVLLKNSNLSIRQISDRLCFSDEHYFSNLFLKKVGVRPKEFILK